MTGAKCLRIFRNCWKNQRRLIFELIVPDEWCAIFCAKGECFVSLALITPWTISSPDSWFFVHHTKPYIASNRNEAQRVYQIRRLQRGPIQGLFESAETIAAGIAEGSRSLSMVLSTLCPTISFLSQGFG